MTEILNKATEIIQTLRNNDHEAYLVGGYVRDMIMGNPSHDIDITTSAHPEVVTKLFKKTLPVGAQFGVIIVLIGNEQFEVATFRNDGQYIDGRRPSSVTFSTAKEDVERRDFTINGLLFDPLEDKIIDYVGGQNDIQQKLIRAIGNPSHRFDEDKLRMMRAVRFSAKFDFTIENETFLAIKSIAPEITVVSTERITEELLRMLEGKNPHIALKILKESNLLKEILPDVNQLKPEDWKDLFMTFETLKPTFAQALSILLAITPANDYSLFEYPAYSQKKNKDTVISKRNPLNLAGQIIKEIITHWESFHLFKSYTNFSKAKRIRFLLREYLAASIEILTAIHSTQKLSMKVLNQIKDDQKNLLKDISTLPNSFLDGNDLMALGIKPGKILTSIKEELIDLQLDEKILTIDQAKEFVTKKYL